MRLFHCLIFLLFSLLPASAQHPVVDPRAVTIARDRWGVPHIFAKTDPEVAYGLAWAHAEDDFKTIQLVALSGKGLLGRYLGKNGAAADYVVELIRARELVEEQYDKDLSPEFKALITGYLQGLNDYARRHPDEVLVRQLFPITPKEYMRAVVLSLSVISGVDDVLKDLFAGRVKTLDAFKAAGSNAFAIHRSKTTDGQTYLAINSHQPLEGPVAWYEAHLCSEQGWNMLGGLFPGGPVIFHGVNEKLGWAHTVNYQDKIDVYQLQMNPDNDNQYRFDGEWLDLEQKTVRLHVKGLPVAIGRKAYWSRYGAVVKTDKGVFAVRFGANQDIRGIEQWYRMNKARSFTEFRRALDMTAIPGFNIIYADYDTIYYVSNGKIPLRDRAFNWQTTLPGNTSRTLWTQFHPLTDLPQLLNPASGYVFNMNHTPFNATGPADNLDPRRFDPTMGYERYDNNRSRRFVEQIQRLDKLSYEDFRRIKYDGRLPDTLLYYNIDVNTLFRLSPEVYPDIREEVSAITNWDRNAAADSRGAALFLLVYQYWKEKNSQSATPKRTLSADDCAEGLRFARQYQQKHFGRTNIVLGDYQKLVRGSRELPVWGIPDVLTSIYAEPYKNGRVRATQGESYIELVRFGKEGLPRIETVNCYGASNRPGSPHYADQMDMFVRQQTKPMTLDKAQALKEAVRVYWPGEN